MNIAIISHPSSLNTADLKHAAEAVNTGCTVYALSDIAFAVESLDAHPFFTHDVYIFRGYNKSYALAQSLAKSLLARGKLVIDAQLASGFIPSKFHEALVYKDAKIPHIPTYLARDFEALLKTGFKEQYPVVIKDVDSQRGRGVRLCHDEETLRTEIQNYGDTIIIQDYLTIAYDVRVLCVGDKVLGAIKRESVSEDFRTNVSLGGKASVYQLNEQEQTLALQAHRSLGYDISGVDIAHDAEGNPLIIETNITPEWQGFQSATNVDVAEKIIEYATERYKNGQKV